MIRLFPGYVPDKGVGPYISATVWDDEAEKRRKRLNIEIGSAGRRSSKAQKINSRLKKEVKPRYTKRSRDKRRDERSEH